MAKKAGSLFKVQGDDAPTVAPQITEAKKPKRGKHLISALFEEPAYKQFTVLAAERGVQKQALLREALNDLFIKHGKPPIA